MKSARSDKWICKEDTIYVPSQIGKTAKYKTRIEEWPKQASRNWEP